LVTCVLRVHELNPFQVKSIININDKTAVTIIIITARRYANAEYDVIVCPSVTPSVCPSITKGGSEREFFYIFLRCFLYIRCRQS